MTTIIAILPIHPPARCWIIASEEICSATGTFGLAFAFLISTFFCLTQTSRVARAEDVPDDVRNWTYWRGPYFDGTSPTTNLPDKWNPKGGPDSNLLWKSEEYKDVVRRSSSKDGFIRRFAINPERPEKARRWSAWMQDWQADLGKPVQRLVIGCA